MTASSAAEWIGLFESPLFFRYEMSDLCYCWFT